MMQGWAAYHHRLRAGDEPEASLRRGHLEERLPRSLKVF